SRIIRLLRYELISRKTLEIAEPRWRDREEGRLIVTIHRGESRKRLKLQSSFPYTCRQPPMPFCPGHQCDAAALAAWVQPWAPSCLRSPVPHLPIRATPL